MTDMDNEAAAENQLVIYYEQEQYALVYYLEHAKPGPVLRQIAEDRIKALDIKKGKADPSRYFPVTSAMPGIYLEERETVGTRKKELVSVTYKYHL